MSIKQFKISSNFCYVVYCTKTKKSAIIDPSYNPSVALEFISSNDFKLEYIINTHHHSDHTASNQEIKKIFSAIVIASIADSPYINGGVEKVVNDSEEIKLGQVILKFLITPGHTPGGLCIIVDNEALLTGDTLFIGDCGRTDLPGGNLGQMYNTLNEKIKTLPDHLIIYPGHDYGHRPYDTLGNQKKTNKTLLAKNLEEFSKIP